MDKAVLKNFAIYARSKLIQDIKNKASMVGITEKGIIDPLPESNSDMLVFDIGAVRTFKISGKEVKQYEKLKKKLESSSINSDYKIAYNGLIEEVAYTWFNRLIAIRFMEVNNYLPNKMRVLSSGREGVNEPEFVTYYLDTGLDFTQEELEQLEIWKTDGSAIAMEKLFHLLFIKQCNALNENLPELFERTDDYAELLLTISYNDPDGVVYKLVHDIPEEYFDIESKGGNGQVEIIGWMYQYYNTERKDEVINIYKGTVKKQDIPAATQLFTTDWVVRYMVDNSLGKYWLERNPDSSIRDSLEYLMPGEIPVIEGKISPEDLKIFDNAMGSGHCLSYAFDLLLKIYESEGYTAREASKLIVEKNLYGLDIDKRAYQLAYFAIMMKARQYNRRALNGELKTNLGVFEDSISINKNHLEYLGLSMTTEKRKEALKLINYLIKEFENATEIGSILCLEDINEDLILEFIDDSPTEEQIAIGEINIKKTQEQLRKLIQVSSLLTQKYDVMVTNPPYLNKFDTKLKKYIWDNYNDYKGDMFSVFIYHNLELCKPNGYSAYMSPFVWMFIKTYEELRKHIIKTKHISSLIQMEYSAYEEATVPICTFVLQNNSSKDKGKYIKLSDFTGGMEVQRVKTLEAIQNPNCGYYYETEQDNFEKIPGMPIAYWVSEKIIKSFIADNLENHSQAIAKGIFTGDNDRFLKLWYEVSYTSLNEKWFKYSKGGPFRKWYGNFEYVVFWMNNGELLRRFKGSGLGASRFFGEKTIVWTKITSSNISFRYNLDVMFDDASPAIIFRDKADNYLLGFLNSKIVQIMINIIAPTMNLQIGDVKKLPYPSFGRNEFKNIVFKIVEHNISISRTDWDSFETSWDFKVHPLLNKEFNPMHLDINTRLSNKTIESTYEIWKAFANSNFNQLKANEEELNRIFIEIYGLEDELTPEISDKDITITKIFDSKEEIYDDIKGNRYILTKEDVIKSFISYAVGCMFGRYSPDVEGLAYAGGEFKEQLKIENGEWKIRTEDGWISSSIDVAEDNIIVITDEEYLGNDIVSRFVDFVRVCYGEESLEKNLKFIADALGGKGTPREAIRNYFLKDFYNDHVKTYQKRPIYWLYDSGRQNGFKALIYMHRYNEDTTGKVRVDYLHETQKAYERTIDNLRDDIEHNKNPREVAKLEKRLTKIMKQLKECKDYDERIAHLALARIPIDLDDGVKVNYDKVQTDEKGKHLNILAKIR
jgi:type II restriction/modification system DNA methylase subunit YeeA